MNAMLQRWHQWLSDNVLPLGMLCFFSGFFILHYDTFFRYSVYLLLLLPALLCLPGDRQSLPLARATPMVGMLLLFFLYLNLSPLWNPAPTEQDPYLKHSAYILLFFYAVSLVVRKRPHSLWPILRVAGVLAALSACYSFWYVDTAADAFRGSRFHGAAIDHPLLSGNVYGLFLAMWLVEQRQADHWPRWWALACVLPVLALVLMTQARSPLLGTIIGACLVLLSLPSRYRTMFLYVAAVAFVFLLLFWEPILQRGLSGRPEIWSTVFGQSLLHPWFGHGLGSEPVFERRYSTLFDAHNVPLAVFFYGGALGLVLWLGVLGCAVQAVWRQRHHVLGLLAAVMLAYGFVTTFFEAGYFINRPKENWFYLWWPLALALGLAMLPKEVNRHG